MSTLTLGSDCIKEALLNLDGVVSVEYEENSTRIRTDRLPPHSFEFTVEGGNDDEIAEVIAYNKPMGVLSVGSVTKIINIFGCAFQVNFTKKEEKSMKLKDLHAGMRVELRNGEQALIVKNGEGKRYLLRDTAVSGGNRIVSWGEGLLRIGTPYSTDPEQWDIMKVWPVMVGINVCDLSDKLTYLPHWERPEEIKEITEEEAMEVLKGHYGVKVIVKRSDT